jgi:YVTN family beta-propeller protein
MPIDTATNMPGTPIDVGGEPFAIAVTPDGKTVYVANTWENTGRPASALGTVTPIATATSRPGPAIQVGSEPWAFAITPDGTTAYVASWQGGTVTPIATATNTAGAPIEVGEGARAIVITPDGTTAYVGVWGNRAPWCRSRPRPTRRGRRSRSATGHMRSRSRPEPAIFDLSAMRCGPACAGRGLPRPEPGADAGPAAPAGAALI